ncbi:protein KIAA2022-like [Arapaima gigas]
MDVLQETNVAVLTQNPTQISGVDNSGSRDQGCNVNPYVATDAAAPLLCSAAANAQKGSHEFHKPAALSVAEAQEHGGARETSAHAISLASCVAKAVSPWSLPEDSDKNAFAIMEPGGISTLTGDCLMQPSRTCLGCFIETKDAGADLEAGIGVKMGDVRGDYDSCSISELGMQCMSAGNSCRYGEQLLSDQLLSYPVHKGRVAEKREAEKLDSDTEDPASKSIYEGLLLDKCNGEEGLLANSSQDWGCFESFISESKMELLDLCSKNELSVNLFSEEDVDNYMFDDDDDSTLSSDVCSLKIRYESFQDNVRDKTNSLQEDTQFNFFPSILVNCTKKDGTAVRKNADGLQLKGDEISVLEPDDKDEKSIGLIDGTPDVSPESNYFFDSTNSAEDSGEYSDDSSCTGSSYDTLREAKAGRRFLSRDNPHSSSQLNYGLRAKRKVRYSEDYLYDVDSLEGERNAEKREKLSVGPKKEEDDDWCPKKRRKSSRKEPPVIIKYIIINRFKGEKHMSVKLGKIDPADLTVSLDDDLLHKYEKLAPLKCYWQKRRREREEQCRLAGSDKFCVNGCRRSFSSSPPKRKYRIANRLRIQRIQTVEQTADKRGSSSSDHKQEGSVESDVGLAGIQLTIAASNSSARSDQSDVTRAAAVKSRSQEKEDKRTGNKFVRIRKFKSEARLRSKKLKELQETSKSTASLAGMCPAAENPDRFRGVKDGAIEAAAGSPRSCEKSDAAEKSTFAPTSCSRAKSTASVAVASSVPVIPGGYLQTLLDVSDSSGSAGISYFPQQHSRYPLGVSQDDKQFASLQLAQSCVLSPPSESELQQSPQNCQIEPGFPDLWHPPPAPAPTPFAPDIPDPSVLPNGFPAPIPIADNLPVSGYGQVTLDDDRLLYEKNYLPEPPLQADADYQACQVSGGEGHLQFQRGTLNTDNGRLISFDSVGSLSVTSSNYSCLSLKSCEKESEEDMSDNFLAHCSPKLVVQQSVDEIAPLRESTDLLDISNFTPDKFRHSSLSEMSPPDTPSLSPQVTGLEMKAGGKAKDFQTAGEVAAGGTPDMKWNCSVVQLDRQGGLFAVNSHQFQFHTFNDDDSAGLVDKTAAAADHLNESPGQTDGAAKGSKTKKKLTSKQNASQSSLTEQKGTKKAKVPKAAKNEKSKTPRQNSRSSKKVKTLLDGKASKGQAGGSKMTAKLRNLIPPGHSVMDGVGGSVAGGGWPSLKPPNAEWSEGGHPLYDDQREFEEPSNILSNIASGMADVQRFMMASIEPLWGPASGVCQTPEANSLKLKTLKILAGTAPESKKKGASSTSPGPARGRKATGKGCKSQTKFASSHSFFPPLALDCSVSNLGLLGTNGPAHKKMYRHKTSTKFPRDENSKGKRSERDPAKDLALVASFEKLRTWTTSVVQSAFYDLTCVTRENCSFCKDASPPLYHADCKSPQVWKTVFFLDISSHRGTFMHLRYDFFFLFLEWSLLFASFHSCFVGP